MLTKFNIKIIKGPVCSIRRLLSIKGIPTLFWSSPKPLNFAPRLITLVFLVIGLILFGFGESILIAANAGVSPWTVLAQGVSILMDWSIGFSTFMISVCVLFLWLPLKQMPGIGTVLNVIIIALMIEFILPYLPTPEGSIIQTLQSMLGVLVTGIGGGIYLISNLGPGPRDGLMTSLQKLTKLPIAWVRSGIEISVVFAGWSLGGMVGLGTLLFAFLIGPAIAASLFVLERCFSDAK